MKKVSQRVISFILFFTIVGISMFSIPVYAILTTCVNDHFSNLYTTFEEDETIIRTPPSKESCAYVAMSMLLTFYDSYWNERFVEDQYEWQNGIYNSDTDELLETFAATEEAADWENYTDTNFPGVENTLPYYRGYAIAHKTEFLESYLVSLGISLGCHLNPNEMLVLNELQIILILSHYLYNIRGFSTSEVTIGCLYDDGDIDNKMREQITKGFPVIYNGRKLSNNEKLGHAFIAYGIEKNNDVLLHTGWSWQEFQKQSNTQYNLDRSIIWLEINEENLPHECSDAYYDTYTNSYMCACNVYYETHPSHTHSYHESYNSTHHFDKCICGEICNMVSHDLTYSAVNDDSHNQKCVECNYEARVDHEHTLIPSNASEHSFECACGHISEIEGHYVSTYANKDNTSHYVKCACGYNICTESHQMVTTGRFAHCTDCGAVFDTWTIPTIKGVSEDEKLQNY